MKEDRKGGRKGKEDRIGEKGLREKHRKNTNTKGNNTQIVTKTNQIFINNLSIFSLHPFFYRVEELEKEKNRRSRFTAMEDEAVMDDVSVRSRSRRRC